MYIPFLSVSGLSIVGWGEWEERQNNICLEVHAEKGRPVAFFGAPPLYELLRWQTQEIAVHQSDQGKFHRWSKKILGLSVSLKYLSAWYFLRLHVCKFIHSINKKLQKWTRNFKLCEYSLSTYPSDLLVILVSGNHF